ncbi:MAG: Xaa-Pro peptidase family protein [Desulfobacula sp.]|nr:Xaa-Pro peptidase family protein [Desulfobacula sp.]
MNQSKKLKRIRELQKKLDETKMDAGLLILSRDVFYYTGTAQPTVFLVTPDDYRLIVRRAFDFAIKETFLDTEKIVNGGSFKQAREILMDLGVKNGTLGLEMDIIPAALYLKIKKIFNKYDLTDISNIIFQQRMQKDDHEIETIKAACRIMDAGHKTVMETLVPGMTELDLAAEIEYAHRRAGHEGVLSMRHFDFYISRGPLCSGKNLFKVSGFANTITGVGLSPAVPAGPSYTKINRGDLIITDIPTCFKGYHCDQTRTYFLGKPPVEVVALFQNLKIISDHAMGFLKEGVTCSRLFETTYNKARDLGVEDYFLGLPPRKGNFVGHGIGLDANEPPILSKNFDFQLRRNFVLTIELHLTHPEYGAVKLEDVVRVKKNGCELLSVTPRKLFAIS